MKTSAIGMVSAAVLILVAGVGFGIAQAGGNQSYDPMLSFGDQDVNPFIGWQAMEALEAVGLFADSDSDSSKLATEVDMYRGWGNNEWGYADAAEARGAVETGSLPAGGNADSSKFPTEEDVYQGPRYIDMGGDE